MATRSNLLRSSWRFAVVGLTSNLLGYLLFVVLSLFGASAFIALTASFLLSMVISYFGNRGFTFAHQGAAGRSAAKFLAVAAFAYAFNFGILMALCTALGLPANRGAVLCHRLRSTMHFHADAFMGISIRQD
ncbi:hypothetical membrane protein [Renibacterium salmoninarum ATCC 33209]|uniref:Hypothetical membrane protein n=1 Tax=Renibacterium salmoninarum (strain ATCC 33209 / DSM 20767 / JCM 11484 / NBRC 15589 / NCIMB 2235) TaxID=288705 RepID=A9WLN7_RENSM|nr:GtrA family protein [Renibacterium salmoninarum]ABY21817.1 hypothetical membrane protein [Renibacterium salmoninarum ATCC 33209]